MYSVPTGRKTGVSQSILVKTVKIFAASRTRCTGLRHILSFRMFSRRTIKPIECCYEQGITDGNLSRFAARQIFHRKAYTVHLLKKTMSRKYGGKKLMKSNLRNEIKLYIVRQGMTMQEVVDLLRDEHGWSDSVSNLSNKLQRESLRYVEAVQLADVLGYEIVWQRKKS